MNTATAFRVYWSPNQIGSGALILCSACNDTWILRDPANRAHYSGNPVPMTREEVAALETPECGSCGRSVLVVVPLSPFIAKWVDDARRAQESYHWELNEMVQDEMDAEPL